MRAITRDSPIVLAARTAASDQMRGSSPRHSDGTFARAFSS